MNPRETPEPHDPAQDAEDGATGPTPGDRPRKAYRTPRLVSYGRLADVTRAGGSQAVDSGSNLGNLPT